MKPTLRYLFILFLGLAVFTTGCKKDKDRPAEPIFFSVNDDIQLGQQLKAEIEANPSEYPLLSEQQYPEAYAILDTIVSKILNSGKIKYKDEFAWEFKIIHDDSTLNAFAAPGGYIYVYTGLIKYLDSEDDLAGVLGHEIAHADLRHTSRQMEKTYGLAILLEIVAGKNSQMLKNIAMQLTSLKFSRDMESEADKFSVIYLCPTDYPADGAANFFEKIEQAGGVSIPEFLSTHPSPDKRIENIRSEKDNRGCTGANTYVSRYQRLINALP